MMLLKVCYPPLTLKLFSDIEKYFPKILKSRVDVCNNLVLAFIGSGDSDNALEVAKLSIGSDPENAKSFFRLG